MARVKFSAIRINETREGRKIVFPYGNDWYKMPWEDVPDGAEGIASVRVRARAHSQIFPEEE